MCFKVFDSMFVLVDLLEIWGFVKCNVECTVSQWLAVPRNKVLGTNPFCVHFSPHVCVDPLHILQLPSTCS